MPRGDKSKYTEKQKRKAEHIEEGYRERGLPEDEAERRAWATVNKMDRGGKKPGGSGHGKTVNKEPVARAARKAAMPPRRGRRRPALLRQKKRLARASATPRKANGSNTS
jgi:hypothetical protein